MSSKPFNPFHMAQAQFDKVAELLGLDQPTKGLLRQPMREYHFSLPIRMDDGTFRVFRGFRVQHNDARGPGKGGIRFHPHSLKVIRGSKSRAARSARVARAMASSAVIDSHSGS